MPLLSDINVKKLFIAVCTLFISTTSYATSNFEADSYYKDGKYEKALEKYTEAADIGNPHAFYQLGRIHYEGLGVKKDIISAIVYFSLAAEYDFSDAQEATNKLVKSLNPNDQKIALELIAAYKKEVGKDRINSKYFPVINTENLDDKLSFGGSGILQVDYNDPELFLNEFSDGMETYSDPNSGAIFEDYDDFFPDNQLGNRKGLDIPLRPLRTSVPFIIVDYDLAPDGSVRNLREVTTFGHNIPLMLNRFSFVSKPPPTFGEKRTHFTGRAFMGLASWSKWEVRERNQFLHNYIKRKIKPLKTSDDIEDLFQYAVALQSFKWVPQEEGESERIMQQVAEAGHAVAQFELGARLYREQRDLETAIDWIVSSSQYGYAPAAYMLGHLLQNSPWVVKDEEKALFWYQTAADLGHEAAALKAADVMLLAQNTSIHNVTAAKTYLDSIEATQDRNPEFYFLRAVARKNTENRDMEVVVKDIKRAISRGKRLNWDVNYWESLLDAWTSGRVKVRDL